MDGMKMMESISTESNLYMVIEKIGTFQRYQKNDIIYFQDDEANTFYLLKSGRVRLFLTSLGGNELTVKILGSNSLFGDASYFSKCPRITSASALSDVELLSVDLNKLLPYLSSQPTLIAELLGVLSQTIRVLSIQVYSMAFLSADKRVAHILVQLGTHFKKKETSQTYTINYTHQELADLMGLARVTTTKELKEFEKNGWLILDYKKIQVVDEESLKDYLLI
jgi:CRP/FNR family transcriptional regulator, cyclic AMP receptor protein